MKANIVRIGNSRGIRLPKSILEHCCFKDAVELEVAGDELIIRPLQAFRRGWDEVFSTMARNKDDNLLDEDTDLTTHWENTEWRW